MNPHLRTITTCSVTLILTSLWGVTSLSAQSTAQTKGDSTETIRITSDLVPLDIVVRDKKGRLVKDLKPEEVRVTDDGKEVKLTHFRFLQGGEGAVVGGPAQPASAVAGPIQPQPQGPSQLRPVMMVFDSLNLDTAKLAREAAYEALKAAPNSKTYFAVFLIDQQLRLVQGFTTDRALIKEAVDKATSGAHMHITTSSDANRGVVKTLAGSPSNQAAVEAGDFSQLSLTGPDRTYAALATDAIRASDEMMREESARPSIGGLLALVKSVPAVGGRKTVLYFAAGMQTTSRTLGMFDAIIGAANRANVSFYTIDVTGLTQDSREAGANKLLASVMASDAHRGVPTANDMRSSDALEATLQVNTQSPMMELADSTGGQYVGDSNDLRKPVQRAMEDVESYYEAEYVPPKHEYDGHFRRIIVTVARPNVKVQARAGYFALPPGSTIYVQPFEVPMLKVLDATPLPTGVRFHSTLLKFERHGDAQVETAVVEVPLSEIQFVEEPAVNKFKMHVAILVAIKDKFGHIVKKMSQDFPYEGSKDTEEASRISSLTFERHFEALPGEYEMEAVVTDGNANLTGAQRSVFEIATPTKALGISSLAFMRRTDPLAENTDMADPLTYERRRVVPDLTGVVDTKGGKGANISAFFTIYSAPGSSPKPSLELEVSRNRKALEKIPVPLPDADNSGAIPFSVSFPAAKFTTGDYELRAMVHQGNETDVASAPFHVEADPEPASAGKAETIPPPDTRPMDSGSNGSAAQTGTAASTAVPDVAELRRVLTSARQRALGNTLALPDFTCFQITKRDADSSGKNDWKPADVIAEKISYHDGLYEYKTVQIDGNDSSVERSKLSGYIFGERLDKLPPIIFGPKVATGFTWIGQTQIADSKFDVFSFQVSKTRSSYQVGENAVGFHGLLYVDPATASVRRVVFEADGLPADAAVKTSSLTADYANVKIGEREYLLPSTATVRVGLGEKGEFRNAIEFRGYSKYPAESDLPK